MLKVGLTGGIASGKSAVANAFAAQGAPVIDTDVLAREATAPGSAGLRALVQAFGEEYVDAAGKLDRGRLRRRVFASPEDRKRLESIVHPLVIERLRGQLAKLDAVYVVIAVPLLVETGMHHDMDRVLVVDCPAAVQIERLRARDGESEESARAILATQADRASRLAAADDVIVNDGSLERLRAEVRRLHERYLDLAAK
ncbi:MAG: dephospho-CoA kinase [Gammaproteobacteria bacterium]|nr:dephospho-CoA kinase [Gammaproteobacteria bacterium]